MQQARFKRLGPYWFYGALAIVGVALAALVGCTLVGDNLTGVNLFDKNGTTTCIKDCNDAGQAATGQCAKDHETAREVCKQQYPEGPGRQACLDAAGEAHGACNAAANAAKEECQNSCHRQGTGSAG